MAHRHALGIRAALLAAAAGFAASAAAQSDGALDARLDALEAQVVAAEDVAAIKRLQRQYGYYVDKGMWEDLADLYTDDAVANYPAGTYVGHDSIRKHLYMNVGGGQVGEIGLADNRIYNHMNIQPVVHLEPGGQTAKGRWRAFAMFGSFGGGATWAEGIYEMTYAKVDGVWKIQQPRLSLGLRRAVRDGLGAARAGCRRRGARAAPRNLPHPADRPRNEACDGFPAACVGPFHYTNPGVTDAGHVWTTVTLPAASGRRPARARARSRSRRARAAARRRAGSRKPAKDLRLLPRPAHVGPGRRPLRRRRHDRDGPARRLRRQAARARVPEPARARRA